MLGVSRLLLQANKDPARLSSTGGRRTSRTIFGTTARSRMPDTEICRARIPFISGMRERWEVDKPGPGRYTASHVSRSDLPAEASMKNKLSICSLLAAALLSISGLTFAHHGSGISYDMTKSVSMEGTVTEFQWRNPHVYVMY